MCPPEPTDHVEQRILDDIDRVGWHSLSIGAGPDGVTPYGYTIGLWRTFGHPELVVTGLGASTGREVRWALVEAIKAGTSFAAGDTSSVALVDADVSFRALDAAACAEWLVFADWFHEGTGWSALQVLWPDPDGRFPTSPDYDADVPQPLLPGPT